MLFARTHTKKNSRKHKPRVKIIRELLGSCLAFLQRREPPSSLLPLQPAPAPQWQAGAHAHTHTLTRQNKGERRKRGAAGLGVGEGRWEEVQQGGGEGVANKRRDCMIRGSRGGERERESE